MLILLLLSDQLHLCSPSAVCHHVCVCFNDGCLRDPLCHIAQKFFFPAHHDWMEPPWQQLGPRRLGGQLQATDGTHTHTHTHTHPHNCTPPPVFCSKNGGNRDFFKSSGICPLSMDLLKRLHSGIAHWSLNSFSTLGGTWSGHWAFKKKKVYLTYPAQLLGLL